MFMHRLYTCIHICIYVYIYIYIFILFICIYNGGKVSEESALYPVQPPLCFNDRKSAKQAQQFRVWV